MTEKARSLTDVSKDEINVPIALSAFRDKKQMFLDAYGTFYSGCSTSRTPRLWIANKKEDTGELARNP